MRQHRALAPRLAMAALGAAGPGAARAADSGLGQFSPVGLGDALQVGIGLVAVLAAIAVAAWVIKRMFRVAPSMRGQLKILCAMAMGARERVVLVQVGETQLLLGVSPGRIQTLLVLETPIEVETAEGPSAPGFARQLERLTHRGGGS